MPSNWIESMIIPHNEMTIFSPVFLTERFGVNSICPKIRRVYFE